MRFNFEAYEKVYPETAPAVSVESAVDTFKPTESEAKAIEKRNNEYMNSGDFSLIAKCEFIVIIKK